MLRIIRLVGGALGVVLAISFVGLARGAGGLGASSLEGELLTLAWVGAWFVIGYAITPYLTVEPAVWITRAVTELSTAEFLAAVAGLLVGLLMGLLLGLPLTNLPDPYGWMLPVGVSVVLGLGMMGLTVAKRADLLETLGRLVRAERSARAGRGGADRPVTYLDTSAIIDGRLVDVVASGFLTGRLVVPRFVLGELQHIADDVQPGRRNRGRRGLDVLEVLQKDHRVDLDLSDEDDPSSSNVDGKLVSLARSRGAAILTTDYNLNRVAQLQGVHVMNLNQLANALKPAFLPGEELRVKVIQPGKEPGQGVAFLDDGTMVVVEGGGSYLQRDLDVTVTRILQTVAGRMVFAEVGVRQPSS
jgi:uncharacterized protein YacL